MGEGTAVPARSALADELVSTVIQEIEGETVQELAARSGLSIHTVQRRLRVRIDKGRVVVGRRQVVNRAGRKDWVPVYRLKEDLTNE